MTVQATESNTKKGLLSGILGGGKTIWVVAILLALLAVFGALTILGNAAATQTYWVLGRDVAARTQVTPDMLVQKEAKVGDAPPTALDAVYVRDNEVFTQIALNAGDVVTGSNAGPLTRITADVPDNFVAASFPAEPEIAVSGKVRKGDFIDLIGTSDEGGSGAIARVVLQHVLVLDVTISPGSIAEEATDGQEGAELNPGPESEAVRGGIPAVYTVALSPEDATVLALVRSYELFVVLSGNLPEDVMNVESQVGNIFTAPADDSAAGTFGSLFIKRWDVAFEVGNVFVDNGGNVWKVNTKGQWAVTVDDTETVLEAGDTPPGYLPIPEGTEFVDKDGVFWLAKKSGLWTSPEKADDDPDKTLEAGDNPTGYDPHAEFKQSLETADDGDDN